MPLKIEKHPEEDVHGGDGAKPSLPPPPQPRGASLERPGKTGDAARDREARGVRRPWRPRRRWSRLILTSRHRRLCLVCHRYRGLRKTDDVSAAEVCGKSCGGVEEGEGVWSAGARLREAAVRAGATARAVRPHRHGPVAGTRHDALSSSSSSASSDVVSSQSPTISGLLRNALVAVACDVFDEMPNPPY